MGALVPIVGIITSIGVPCAMVVLIVFLSHKKDVARYNLIEKALQSNASPEAVENLLQSINDGNAKNPVSPKQRNLTHATIFLALGISFFVLRLIISGNPDDVVGLVAAGAVLTMLGLAKLVIAFFIVGKPSDNK